MGGRLVLNCTTEIRVSRGEISGAYVSEAAALWLQTMVALTTGDTVELQGNFRAADGYFAADHTSLWGGAAGYLIDDTFLRNVIRCESELQFKRDRNIETSFLGRKVPCGNTASVGHGNLGALKR